MKGLRLIKREFGSCAILVIRNSDLVYRADEVMALGYPLGQESLKSTTGVISGRESNMIQMSAAINPGSSGGPLLNLKGKLLALIRQVLQKLKMSAILFLLMILKLFCLLCTKKNLLEDHF